jgi:CheY-like chemotaxis protein
MKPRPKVLLIEDNIGDSELIIEAFSRNKTRSELFVISNGDEAMRFLKLEADYKDERLPDLILLDLNLPKIDGKEVLTFIKNDNDLKRIPVIVFTTSSLQKDISYSYNNHANCYIVKPGNLNDFIEAVNAIEDFWLNCVIYPKKN